MTDSARKPLDEIVVVDFTTMVAGPYCTRFLADAGAEVIKVETDGGDLMRDVSPHQDGISLKFAQFNAGKKVSYWISNRRPGSPPRAI